MVSSYPRPERAALLVFLLYACPEEFVSRIDADVVAEVVVAADFFHPQRGAVADGGLEEMRGRIGRGAVPVLDAGTGVLRVALTKAAGALAALLHASDAFVDHQNLSAGVAVPIP